MSDLPEPLYNIINIVGSIDERRSRYFDREEKLYSHMGLFINCYALAETSITVLLMAALGIKSRNDMSVIASRVSAPDKINKIKTLLSNKGRSVDPALSALFNHFIGPITRLRNVIAHDLTNLSDDGDMVIIDISDLSVSRMTNGGRYSLDAIFQHAEWTKIFAQIVLELAKLLNLQITTNSVSDRPFGFDTYPISPPIKPKTPPAPGKP